MLQTTGLQGLNLLPAPQSSVASLDLDPLRSNPVDHRSSWAVRHGAEHHRPHRRAPQRWPQRSVGVRSLSAFIEETRDPVVGVERGSEYCLSLSFHRIGVIDLRALLIEGHPEEPYRVHV